MNDRDTEHFKKLLEKQMKEIENTLGIMKENNTAEQELNSPTELSNYDNHPAEIASELFQVEMNTALKVHEENILTQIMSALGRIGDGSFGKCVRCSAEIPPERLEVLPYAEMCINCEKEDEDNPERRRKERPNEERVLDAPLGRKYLNRQEDDEHEGLDQFNDLMKYGSSDSPQDLGGYHDYEEYYTNEADRQGIVDDMDRVSNEQYKQQLPD